MSFHTPGVMRPSRPPMSCRCTEETAVQIAALPVAMAYVPVQTWQSVYDGETALERGTLFPCLDLPFLAYGRVNA